MLKMYFGDLNHALAWEAKSAVGPVQYSFLINLIEEDYLPIAMKILILIYPYSMLVKFSFVQSHCLFVEGPRLFFSRHKPVRIKINSKQTPFHAHILIVS